MKSRLRPSRSVSRPNTSAPTTSPKRYTDPSSPTWPLLRASVPFSCSVLPIAETIWISSPSRIQAVPRPNTIIQWNRAHGRRSMRAGTRLLTTGRSAVSDVIARSPDVIVVSWRSFTPPPETSCTRDFRDPRDVSAARRPPRVAAGEPQQPLEGARPGGHGHLRPEVAGVATAVLRRDHRPEELERRLARLRRRRPRQVERARQVPPVHEVLPEDHREDGATVHPGGREGDLAAAGPVPDGCRDRGRRRSDDVRGVPVVLRRAVRVGVGPRLLAPGIGQRGGEELQPPEHVVAQRGHVEPLARRRQPGLGG